MITETRSSKETYELGYNMGKNARAGVRINHKKNNKYTGDKTEYFCGYIVSSN